jgi:Na+/proline symporter
MNTDTKIGIAGIIQVLAATCLFIGTVVLKPETLQLYRLWEIFPALIASSITTFGLKEIRKKT